MVACILHDYVAEARQMGYWPGSLQPMPGTHRQSGIFPKWPELPVHTSTHTKQMSKRDI